MERRGLTKSRKLNRHHSGFALISALWFSAILTIVSLAGLRMYLANTQMITDEVRRIQLDLLHDAALKHAVLTLLEPKASVSAGGLLETQFVYPNHLSTVIVNVRNESAFVDLLRTDLNLLESIFKKLELSAPIFEAIKTNRNATAPTQENQITINFRWLKKQLASNEKAFELFTRYTTFYNGSAQINPYLANQVLLTSLPNLNDNDVNRIMEYRNSSNRDRVTKAISHPMLRPRLSSYFRVRTQIILGNIKDSKTRIIQITNNDETLFKIAADL